MIKALCLFKVNVWNFTQDCSRKLNQIIQKGIRPEWEDPANAHGCEFHAIRTLTKENVDVVWENLVLAVIGMLDKDLFENYIRK